LNSSGQLGGAAGTISSVPVAVSGLASGVAAIAAGGFHTCALTTGGGVWCWGFNENGQLGNDTTTDSGVPVAVAGASSDVEAIAAGAYHTCALTTGGGALCWGLNDSGQLGDATTTESHVPVAVTGVSSGVEAIAAGAYHTCALTAGGGASCWGSNGSGQLGNGSTTNSSVPVAVSDLANGVAVLAAGGFHTCALPTGSGALCWGSNVHGQLGNGTNNGSSVPIPVVGFQGLATVPALGTAMLGLLAAMLGLTGISRRRPVR
jgi:alpha-tubulin suppressor-like RCC1 family protein